MAGRKRAFYILLTLLFLGMLLMNLLTPAEADDYSYMYSYASGERVRSVQDVVASGIAHFKMMNGRVVSHSLFAQPLHWAGKPLFNLLNSLVYIAFLLGIYLTITPGARYDWGLLLAIHAAVFLFAPVFGVTVLWMTGACNYLWPLTLILYALLPFHRAVLGKELPRGHGKRALFVLAALCGGNGIENTSLAMLALMGGILIWLRRQKRRISWDLYLFFFMGCLGYGILMAARAGLLTGQALSPGTYIENFIQCTQRLLEQKWIFCAYAALLILSWADPAMKGRRDLSIGLAGCALLANMAMVVAGYYPRRADFGWIILLLAACGLLLPALESLRGGILRRILTAGLTLMAVFTFLNVMPKNYNRYRQAEARIAHVMEQREAGLTDAVTFGIKSKSPYDVFGDGTPLSADAEYRPNACFAKLYGVHTLTISDEVY